MNTLINLISTGTGSSSLDLASLEDFAVHVSALSFTGISKLTLLALIPAHAMRKWRSFVIVYVDTLFELFNGFGDNYKNAVHENLDFWILCHTFSAQM